MPPPPVVAHTQHPLLQGGRVPDITSAGGLPTPFTTAPTRDAQHIRTSYLIHPVVVVVVGSRGGSKKAASKKGGDGKGVAKLGGDVINVFTVASGHMYERLQKIMILSVVKNTKSRCAASPHQHWRGVLVCILERLIASSSLDRRLGGAAAGNQDPVWSVVKNTKPRWAGGGRPVSCCASLV